MVADLDDQDVLKALNILGKPTSFTLEGPPDQTPLGGAALPTIPSYEGGPSFGPASGGAGARGTGFAGLPSGITPERSNLPALAEETGMGMGQLGKIAQGVFKLGKEAGKMFGADQGSHEMGPETRRQFEAQRASERTLETPAAVPTSFAEGLAALSNPTPGVLGATSGPMAGPIFSSPEAGAAAGEALGEAFGAGAGAPEAGASVLGQVGSIAAPALATALSAYKAAMADNDFDKARMAAHAALYAASPFTMGISGIAAGVADAIDAIIQAFGGPTVGELLGFGPSEDWQSFGERLAGNLETTGNSLEQLGLDIVNAGSDADISSAIGRYKQTIGGFAGGFGQGSGEFDIPVPPGATGTEHEGGLTANWEGAVNMLNQMMADRRARGFAPPELPPGAAPAAPPEAAPEPVSQPAAQAVTAPSAPRPVLGRDPGQRGLFEDEDDV